MWIDSHCHLNHKKIADLGSPGDIINDARANDVEGMLTINCRMSDEFTDIRAIAEAHDNVWCSLGTHPHEASKPEENAISLEEIVELAQHEKVVGIGETGLDYYYDFAEVNHQKSSFIKHLNVCAETKLPVIIHARDADDDIAAILRDEGAGERFTGVMHCFSSGAKLAQQALDMGFYISFSGIVTFNKADELRDIAANVPLDRLLVETDAPYLAPMPYRGKTNSPAYVKHTGEKLAELHNISKEDLANHSKNNFFRLFDKAKNTYIAS